MEELPSDPKTKKHGIPWKSFLEDCHNIEMTMTMSKGHRQSVTIVFLLCTNHSKIISKMIGI